MTSTSIRRDDAATGNSGGATQASCPLGYYGLDTIVTKLVAKCAPPAAITNGCLKVAGFAYTRMTFQVLAGVGHGVHSDAPESIRSALNSK